MNLKVRMCLIAGTVILIGCSALSGTGIGSGAGTGMGSSAGAAALPAYKTTSTATVSVGPTSGLSLDSTFAGFSYEKSILSEPLFDSGNKVLIQLFQNLGPGILRIGGNSVNKTTWDPNGTGLTAGSTSPADVDRLAAFLRATGWRVIYGLNATTSSASLSAAEAAYASTSLGSQLYGFEIGNEPDLYASNGLKPSTYDFSDFLSDWDSYSSAIETAVSGAVMTGPAAAYNYAAYTIPFASSEAKKIQLLTQHYYRANGQSTTSTIDLLLSPDPNLPKMLTALASAASGNSIPDGYRLAEANSFYNGGAPGISDAFGSALWVVEFCFALAENGATGVNFHGGGSGTGYTPIANDSEGNVLEARPEYYGMLLFSMMAKGALLTTEVSETASALYAFAVGNENGGTSIVLLNNSRTDVVGVRVQMPQAVASANALILTAPTLDSTSGETFGGSTIAPDGTWSATQTYQVPFQDSQLSLDVFSGSAILMQVNQ